MTLMQSQSVTAMTKSTKQIISDLGWQQGYRHRDQHRLLSLMTEELRVRVHENMTSTAFRQAVREVRVRWNAVSNKIPGGLPEGTWSYWYATEVVRLRTACVKR